MKVNKLGDIACFSQGIQVAIDKQYNKIEEGYVRFLRIIDYTQNKDEIRYIDNPGERYLVNNNDVVMIRYGDAGKVVKGYEGAIANNLFKICIDEKLIIREYLYYYLSQENIYKQLTNSQQKTGLPAVNFKTVSEIKIVYPESIAIQKNIVKILDKAQELIDKRKEQIESLDELVKSQFIEMFGEPVLNTKHWEVKPVIDMCDCMVPGRDKPKSFTGATPWITIEDLKVNGTTFKSKSNLGLTDDEINEVKRKKVPKGSVLMSCVGNLGICSIAGEEMIINQQLHSFQCKSINNVFLMYYLGFRKDYMVSQASSTTILYMNKTACNSIPVYLPPIELQNQFSDFVKQVDKLKFEMEKSLKELEDNFNSLMQKAFKGELFN